ncbi:hypothetical protein UlMin_000768 [Ulmus minor]
MAGWQRHIQYIFRHVGKRVEHRFNPSANLSCSHFETLSLPYLQRLLKPPSANRPFYQYSQQLLLADLSDETLVRSPLTPALALNSGKSEDQDQKVVSKPDKVQVVLKCIKQVRKYYIFLLYVKITITVSKYCSGALFKRANHCSNDAVCVTHTVLYGSPIQCCMGEPYSTLWVSHTTLYEFVCVLYRAVWVTHTMLYGSPIQGKILHSSSLSFPLFTFVAAM